MMSVPFVLNLLILYPLLLLHVSGGAQAWVVVSSQSSFDRPTISITRARDADDGAVVDTTTSSKSLTTSSLRTTATTRYSSLAVKSRGTITRLYLHNDELETVPHDPVVATTSSRRVFSTNLLTRMGAAAAGIALMMMSPAKPAYAKNLILDVNNALGREYTAFPGLYPTVATKLVNAAKKQPFTSKSQVYAVLSESEAERLRQYDKNIVINKVDKSLQQFKTSQICKYECGSRVSNSYRDEQIKQVQKDRR